MSEAVRKKALDYLAGHNVMSLATAGPEGVWAAAVFYVNDGFTCYFLSSPSTRHSQAISITGRAAATIQEDYREWRQIKGIQLEGKVARVDGSERTKAIALYGMKFPLIGDLAAAPAEIARAMSKVSWYRLSPDRLFMVDNSVGFGHRDDVTLP